MQRNLTNGNVTKTILKLAIPIIGSSFMQLAYNLIDMLWVGKLGSDAVAAVGTSGFYLHLGWAIASVIMMGTGITVAQLIGNKELKKAKETSTNGLVGVLVLTVTFIGLIQLFYNPLIGFFNMNSTVEELAFGYLRWSSTGLILLFTFQLFSRISNARGDSKTPFRVSLIGILLNIILDPIFIFTFDFGVIGAAWASIISQFVVVTIFWIKSASTFLVKKEEINISIRQILKIAKLGLPPSVQYMIFSIVAIIMAKIVSSFGSEAIAAQKIGHQIESITFMTIGGLNGAILSYTGQNYGAKLFERVRKGYWAGIRLSVFVGIIMTTIFLLFSKEMVGWFVDDPTTIEIGASYLRIVGLSQIFMSIEMTATGIINGIGKTRIPASINTIIMIFVRVPLALYLSQENIYGINGVWYAILISTLFRGTAVNIGYHLIKDKYLKTIKL